MSGEAKVIDAFAVERKGEAERYRPYANLPNRVLLYVTTSRLASCATTHAGSRDDETTGGTGREWPT
jgi:hypothetical protein